MPSDSIKFTVEVECERKLPFLDILLRRTESNFEYSVCRKLSNNNAPPHFFSFHHIKIKRSVLSGSYLRALRVCSSTNLNFRIQFLHTIFSKPWLPKASY